MPKASHHDVLNFGIFPKNHVGVPCCKITSSQARMYECAEDFSLDPRLRPQTLLPALQVDYAAAAGKASSSDDSEADSDEDDDSNSSASVMSNAEDEEAAKPAAKSAKAKRSSSPHSQDQPDSSDAEGSDVEDAEESDKHEGQAKARQQNAAGSASENDEDDSSERVENGAVQKRSRGLAALGSDDDDDDDFEPRTKKADVSCKASPARPSEPSDDAGVAAAAAASSPDKAETTAAGPEVTISSSEKPSSAFKAAPTPIKKICDAAPKKPTPNAGQKGSNAAAEQRDSSPPAKARRTFTIDSDDE